MSSITQAGHEVAAPVRPSPHRLVSPVRNETWLTWFAFVLISLHIADEAFVQTEPGTRAGDHLISGTVPVLVLLVAGTFVPRLRAGAHSVAALLLGAFGVVAGASEAGEDQIAGRFSGDDYTGLPACAGGLVLLVVGICLLWRTVISMSVGGEGTYAGRSSLPRRSLSASPSSSRCCSCTATTTSIRPAVLPNSWAR
jgi:hypothetical protein